MRVFKVLLEGTNAEILLAGKPTRLGFYTTRFVEADDATAARAKAEAKVLDQLSHQIINDVSAVEIVDADVTEVPSSDATGFSGTGFTFYPMDEA